MGEDSHGAEGKWAIPWTQVRFLLFSFPCAAGNSRLISSLPMVGAHAHVSNAAPHLREHVSRRLGTSEQFAPRMQYFNKANVRGVAACASARPPRCVLLRATTAIRLQNIAAISAAQTRLRSAQR